jgi:hypothetical protein
MSKKFYLIGLGFAGVLLSQAVLADWQSECQSIESQGPATGACNAIQSKVNGLQPYAPFQPFHDTTVDGSTLSTKFPWGTPLWASGAGSGGTTTVPTDTSTTDTGTTSTTDTTSGGTFQ